MSLSSILADLQAKGTEKARIMYARHGNLADRSFGTSFADIKLLAKTIKGRQDLALELYATGMMEAMYLAGSVVDGAKMSREQLQSWAEGSAGLPTIYDYTVAWATVDHPDASQIALEWIASPEEHIASAGWRTYSGLVTIRPDAALDLDEVAGLLARIPQEIATAPNRVRAAMNGFVIAVGAYVAPLLETAKATAGELGAVSVDVGDTACKIPLATAYIEKFETSGTVGKKRKTIRC